MTKIKKILLGVSPALAAATMAVTAVSCSSRFDQEEDDKLIIASGFSDGNKQGMALQGVVNAYNEWLNSDTTSDNMTAAQKKEAGYLKAEITTLTNGYDTTPLESKLKSKDKNDFWNIMINYPAAAAILSHYEMNASIPKEIYDKLGIAASFNDVNQNIAGNVKDEIWSVPLSRSSEMASIDKLLLGKMLSELKDNYGVTVSGTKVESYIQAYTTNTTDKEHIDGLWKSGAATEEQKSDVTKAITNFLAKMPTANTITDEMFSSYDQLITVAQAMKSMYPNNNFVIIGLDSLPNAINLMTTSKTNGHPLNGYIKKEGPVFNYGAFLKEGTPQYDFFKGIMTNIINAMNQKAVQVFGAGAYGSVDLTAHKLAISIGSTAGYSHTYYDGDDAKVTYKLNDENLSNPILLVKPDRALDDNTLAKFTDSYGKYINNLMKPGAKIGPHDKGVNTEEIANKIKELEQGTAKNLYNNNKNASSIEFYGTFVEGKVEGNVLKINNGSKSITLTEDQKSQIVSLGKVFKNSEADYVYIPVSLLTASKKVTSASELLNKEEADWLPSPMVQAIQNETKSIWAQGPSLIPIHANEKEDKATALFIEWLYTYVNPSVSAGQDDKKPIKNVTGIIAFNKKGNYIAPTTEFLQDEENSKKMNAAEKIAFNGFNLTISDSSQYIIAEDVPSKDASKFRNAVTSVAKNAFASKSVVTFESFITELQGLMK